MPGDGASARTRPRAWPPTAAISSASPSCARCRPSGRGSPRGRRRPSPPGSRRARRARMLAAPRPVGQHDPPALPPYSARRPAGRRPIVLAALHRAARPAHRLRPPPGPQHPARADGGGHLGRVADPAAGSWYVESLTDRLARAGWAFMQAIEAQGGAAAALESGWLAAEVAKARAGAGERCRHAQGPGLIGVSEFPDLAEAPVEVEPRPPLPATDARSRPAPSEPFERLRARAGYPPGLAGAARRPGRSTPAALALRATSSPPAGSRRSGRAGAFTATQALAVICGSDERYAERPPTRPARSRPRARGPSIWPAGRATARRGDGRPGCGFLFAGVDVVAALTAMTLSRELEAAR